MPINKFNTNLDLARQAKIYSGETAEQLKEQHLVVLPQPQYLM